MIDLNSYTIEKLKNNASDLIEIAFQYEVGGKEENLQFMASILEANTSLTSYSICNPRRVNNVYTQYTAAPGITLIAEALKKNKTLKILSLNHFEIIDNDIAALADMLAINETLVELNLNRCSINGKRLEILARGLAANKGLKKIHLGVNEIGKDISAFEIFIESLLQNNSLSTLTLDRNSEHFTSEHAKLLKKLLQHNKTLKALDLCFIHLDDEGAVELAKGLAFNTTLSELELSGNNIGPEGAKALADAIHYHPALTMLDLSSNNIGPVGAEALATAIKNHPSFMKLRVCSNEIEDRGAQAFISVLIDDKNKNILAELILNYNKITEKSIKPFKMLIEKNRRLAILSISLNHFGSKGVQEFSKAISNNQTLNRFNFHGISTKVIKNQETIAALTEISTRNTTLVSCSLPADKIEYALNQQISRTFRNNETQSFNLLKAVYDGEIEMVTSLLESGVSPYFLCYSNARRDMYLLAQQQGKIYAFQPALFVEASKFNKIGEGDTLLHMTIRQQHLHILQLLLKHEKAGALLNIRNDENETAVQLAQNLEEPAFYQAFLDAKLINQKPILEEQTAQNALAAKRARSSSNSEADAPLPVPANVQPNPQIQDSRPPASNTRSKRAKLG